MQGRRPRAKSYLSCLEWLCLHPRLVTTARLVWHFLVAVPKATDQRWGILPSEKENRVFSFECKNVYGDLESEERRNPILPRIKQITALVA